ncbi:MAG: serine/threonine-protein kinase [Acidobacteriota bacterium]|nr:serine/threonine protein kinase [Blastocatellia bacterium]MDW8412200.1 serine/threonine-protein kinase [Acidobacteriota bacterium]
MGQIIDSKYLIEEVVGQGGMGKVYRARHIHMDTKVAVKILHPHLVSDSVAVERFRREARVALAVDHPNAIKVMDFGVSGRQTVYLVMEFLEGQSLRQIISQQGALPAARVVEIAQQICAALDSAHAKGIIHRDIKPDNVILINPNTPQEVIKVLDFSIAKLKTAEGAVLTQQGMVVGTPQYMSPEQGEGRELDHRSDIYSLGVILYELLTGHLPFKGSSPIALVLNHIHSLPKPLRELNPQVPPAIEAVVLKALAKKREDRQQSAKQLADELVTALSNPLPREDSLSSNPASIPPRVALESGGQKSISLTSKPLETYISAIVTTSPDKLKIVLYVVSVAIVMVLIVVVVWFVLS